MIFIGLFHSISYFISERDYSIFYEELQRLFGDGSDEKIWLRDARSSLSPGVQFRKPK